MDSGGSDDSHWDSDRKRERDDLREPRRHRERRAPVQLSMHGTVKQIFAGARCARCGELLPAGHAGTLCPFFCLSKVIGRTKESDLDRCYACDARASGTRDRRPEGGKLEQACARHADGPR